MKVLIASDSYKYQTSGVANVVITLAEELRSRGHQVKVLALSNTRKSFKDGDDYYIGSLPGVVYPDVRVSFVRHNKLLKELKAWNPDVIHMHTETSAARMARSIANADNTPFVMTCHTDYAQFVFGSRCESRPVKMIFHEIGKFLYRGAMVVTAPSDKALGFSTLSRLKHPIEVIPNGIRLEQYQKKVTPEERKELFERWNLKDNGKVVCMVSRVSHEKKLDEIVEYFPEVLDRLPDAQLLIVGDGPARAKLETMAKELGIADRVCFTGRISPELVYMYYDMGDVFVSASTFEVHSLTYLEAISHGLPLICRDDPCLRGVLENERNGYAYKTKEEFVENVVSLLTDKELHDRMGSESLTIADNFSAKRCADRMIELYESVLKDNKESITEAEM
ncbi:MAG: glycosyltransferase [Lachnospiraceae bacterium]|nr:glycosyltransferase [Lachnospiraceae bacterium]